MSKSSELNLIVKQYLLDCIDDDDTTFKNNQEKINYAKKRFYSEYGFKVNQVGQQNAIKEWLMGLALNCEFYNYEILKLAVKWNSIPFNYTEKQANKILENYWLLLAVKLDQLFRGSSTPKKLNLFKDFKDE